MNLLPRLAHWLLQVHRRLKNRRHENGFSADALELVVEPSQSLYGDPVELSLDVFIALNDQVIDILDGPMIGFSRQAIQTAFSHTAEHADVESGGLCVGNVFREQGTNRLLLQLVETIPASADSSEPPLSGPAHLTFTPETWHQLVDVYLEKFAEIRILGWYHSHPGMDVFLSSMDMFIQNNFFTAAWQIAVVVDPLRKKVGFFTRQSGQRMVPSVVNWDIDFSPPSEPLLIHHLNNL